MPLSTALNIAQNSLYSVTRRVGVVARNVSEAGNENYARRNALTESTAPGERLTQNWRGRTGRRFPRAQLKRPSPPGSTSCTGF
jgi:flagellar hook-associated protein FlgK